MSFKEIRDDFNEFWKRANTAYQPFIRQAQTALDAYAGRAWFDVERQKLRLQQREAKEFNIIRPKVNAFSGFARDNIKSTIVTGRNDDDIQAADDMTDALLYVYDRANATQHILNGFDDCLKTGLSLVGIWLDFSKDKVFGDIKFYKRSFNSFIIDPDFTSFDLSDASEVAFRDFVTREDAKIMLPFVDPKAIDEVPTFNRDDKFKLLRGNRRFFNRPDLLSYDSYYRMVNQNFDIIVDLNSGLSRNLSMLEQELPKEELKERIQIANQNEGINLKLDKETRRVAELNILLSGEPVYQGPDPLGLEDYPFIPMYCYWEPQLDNFELKFQGIATALVDVQRSFNKRMIRKEDVMDSVANTGFIYKPGKFPDLINGLTQSGAGILIPAGDDADLNADIKPIEQGSIPPGWQEDIAFNQNLSFEIAGINESLMGVDEGGNTQVSGRLAMVRAANGLRANRAVFDNFERSQKLLGDKVLRAIQKNYGPRRPDESPVKLIRILGREPDPKMLDPSFDDFDVSIKQGVLTQTQKDALYFELVNLVQMGFDIDLDLLLRNLPITGLSEVLKSVEEKKQQQQAAQQVIQEQQARDAALQESMTNQNIALAQERRARVLSDIGLARERVTESIDNRADASLKRAKTMAEIEKLSTEKLQVLVDLLGTFDQAFNAQEEQAIENDVLRERDLAQAVTSAPEENLNVPQGTEAGGVPVQPEQPIQGV